jgi:quinol monooxygenase YgiN
MAAQGGDRSDPQEIASLQTGQPGTKASATAYLRVSRGRFPAASYDEVIRVSKELADAVRRLDGCQRYQGGVDRVAGTIVAVSTWDSEAHAHFSRDVLGTIVPQLLALGVELEAPEVYAVVYAA